MRYMTLVKSAEGTTPPPAMYEAMDKYIAEEAQKGVFLEGGGLAPTARGARVRITRGKLHVIDGPFTEAKEVIGGYAILNYNSHEEALAGAKAFMELHLKHWPEWDGECEIRPIEP